MPRYVIQRDLGDISDEQLEQGSAESERVRTETFPEIDWEHSHVVRVGDALRSYCIYRAPGVEMVRAHAEAAGLPADAIHEIHTDIVPPGRA